jgi:hypothetical protein
MLKRRCCAVSRTIGHRIQPVNTYCVIACRALLKCLEQLEAVEEALLTRKPPDEETLADMDRCAPQLLMCAGMTIVLVLPPS